MATTYLTLTNRVLRELNETELTSSTFASSRGIQTAVKDFVNKGIHDIYNETGEIPLLYTRTTQDLVVGDKEYDFPESFEKYERKYEKIYKDFESFEQSNMFSILPTLYIQYFLSFYL